MFTSRIEEAGEEVLIVQQAISRKLSVRFAYGASDLQAIAESNQWCISKFLPRNAEHRT